MIQQPIAIQGRMPLQITAVTLAQQERFRNLVHFHVHHAQNVQQELMRSTRLPVQEVLLALPAHQVKPLNLVQQFAMSLLQLPPQLLLQLPPPLLQLQLPLQLLLQLPPPLLLLLQLPPRLLLQLPAPLLLPLQLPPQLLLQRQRQLLGLKLLQSQQENMLEILYLVPIIHQQPVKLVALLATL